MARAQVEQGALRGCPTEAEWAYIAGLFEGEGTVGLQVKYRKGVRREDCALYPRARVKMTDLEPIARLEELLGGSAYAYEKKLPSGKTLYEWNANGLVAVRALYEGIRPWLSPRRLAKFAEVLSGT